MYGLTWLVDFIVISMVYTAASKVWPTEDKVGDIEVEVGIKGMELILQSSATLIEKARRSR